MKPQMHGLVWDVLRALPRPPQNTVDVPFHAVGHPLKLEVVELASVERAGRIKLCVDFVLPLVRPVDLALEGVGEVRAAAILPALAVEDEGDAARTAAEQADEPTAGTHVRRMTWKPPGSDFDGAVRKLLLPRHMTTLTCTATGRFRRQSLCRDPSSGPSLNGAKLDSFLSVLGALVPAMIVAMRTIRFKVPIRTVCSRKSCAVRSGGRCGGSVGSE